MAFKQEINPLVFTVPFNATTGARIVLDGTTGRINVYNSSNVLIACIDPQSLIGAVGPGVYIGTDLNNVLTNAWASLTPFSNNNTIATLSLAPAGLYGLRFDGFPGTITAELIDGGSANPSQAGMTLASPIDNNFGVGSATSQIILLTDSHDGGASQPANITFLSTDIFFNLNKANTTQTHVRLDTTGVLAPAGYAPNPSVGMTSVDNWNTLSLVNGWSGTFKYRAVMSPANCIQLLSTTLTAGTKADGTTIGTLPLGWRPSQNFDVLCSVNGTVSGGQNPHFAVGSTGVISCWGWANATTGMVNGLVATDF